MIRDRERRSYRKNEIRGCVDLGSSNFRLLVLDGVFPDSMGEKRDALEDPSRSGRRGGMWDGGTIWLNRGASLRKRRIWPFVRSGISSPRRKDGGSARRRSSGTSALRSSARGTSRCASHRCGGYGTEISLGGSRGPRWPGARVFLSAPIACAGFSPADRARGAFRRSSREV